MQPTIICLVLVDCIEVHRAKEAIRIDSLSLIPHQIRTLFDNIVLGSEMNDHLAKSSANDYQRADYGRKGVYPG